MDITEEIDTRSAVYLVDGRITCEIDHPEYGWLPITIDQTDYPALWATVVGRAVAPYVPDSAAEQEQRAAAVNAERQRRIDQGTEFAVSWQADPIPMTGREQDQTAILGLRDTARDLLAAGETGALITYRDGANVIHTLTASQFLELTGKAMAWISQVMAASWALKDNPPIPADFADDKHWP